MNIPRREGLLIARGDGESPRKRSVEDMASEVRVESMGQERDEMFYCTDMSPMTSAVPGRVDI